MIKQLIINGKKSFDDFGVYIGERNISSPEKKSIKESVPYSNVTYDFSKLNGEIYWEERTLEYSFDIAEIKTEDMEIVKSKLLNWLLNVHDTDIYDPYIGDYHFHGSYDSDSWEEDFGAGTITVTFSVYPYKISNNNSNVIELIGVSDGLIEGNYTISGLKVDGKSTQKTTNGYNLVDFSDGASVTGVTTTFENDVLTVVGDGTLKYQNYGITISDVILNNPSKVLYFDFEKVETVNEMDGTIVQLNIAKTDGTSEYKHLIDKYGGKAGYTIPSDTSVIKSVGLHVYTTNSGEGSSANTVTMTKPMLQFGRNELEYEEYTGGIPKPNPDYPSEIKSVGDFGSVEFISSNANLLSSRIGTTTLNGVTVSYDEDTQILTFNGTCTADNTCFTLYRNINGSTPLLVRKGETLYSQVIYVAGSSTGSFNFRAYDKDWGFNLINFSTDGVTKDMKKQYTPTNDVEFTRIDIRLNDDSVCDNLQIKLMLSKVDCEYVPREASSVTIELSEPLRSSLDGKVCDTYKNDVITRNLGSVVLNGTEDWKMSTVSNGNTRFALPISNAKPSQLPYNSHFTSNYSYKYGTGFIGNYGEIILMCDYSTVDEFKAWLTENNIEIIYKLATPITETIEQPTITSYKDVTNVLVDSGIQTTYEVYYNESKNITIINNSSHRIAPTIISDGSFTIKFNNSNYSIGSGTYTSGLYLDVGENNLTISGSGKITFSYVEEVF